MCVELGCWR